MRRKIPKYFQVSLFFLPLLLGLVLSITFQGRSGINPVFRFQARADLGTLALIGGTALTVIFLGVWIAWNAHNRLLQRSLSVVKRETAKARRRFLGRLDHELKNSLTALQVQLDYLSDVHSRPDYAKTHGDMSFQLERLKLLVNGLRELAYLEERPIDFKPVEVGDLLSEVIETAQAHPQYLERHVKLTLLQTPWKFTSVQGDRSLLSLACYNLLDNALKFTHSGDTVELRAFEMHPWLVIEIADDGPGISDHDLPFIFEELYRGNNARGYPGSGLGLALVKAIIERHEGIISVRSRPEQGTVFTVRLPVS